MPQREQNVVSLPINGEMASQEAIYCNAYSLEMPGQDTENLDVRRGMELRMNYYEGATRNNAGRQKKEVRIRD